MGSCRPLAKADTGPKSSTNSFAHQACLLMRPKLEGQPATDIYKIEITECGITKLLSELNANKSHGQISFQMYSSKCYNGEIFLFKIYFRTL